LKMIRSELVDYFMKKIKQYYNVLQTDTRVVQKQLLHFKLDRQIQKKNYLANKQSCKYVSKIRL